MSIKMYIRQPAGNIFLMTAFTLIIAAVIMPFLAEILYAGAANGYRSAMKLSPFNAEYAAASGRLLLDHAAEGEGKAHIYWLEKAEDAYRRAVQLDPRCAEYALRLGQADMRLFLYGNDKKAKTRAFDWFKRALRNDPNGFNVSYP